jgi:hypothetical protein
MKSVFDEIFDLHKAFLGAEHESGVIFCPIDTKIIHSFRALFEKYKAASFLNITVKTMRQLQMFVFKHLRYEI